MLRIFLIIVLITCTLSGFTQVRATTESGNKVLLFDNGSWQYEEKKADQVAMEVPIVVGVASTSLVVDSTLEKESKWQELFYLPSPRLVRYFGELKGKIRCKVSCSNTLGKVQIHFMWEIPHADGTGYFGNLKAGSKITIHLMDGQKVELLTSDESSVKVMEKFNFSIISGATQPLSNEEITALCAQPFRKIEVDWKKKPEVYEVEIFKYFMDTLPTVY